MRIKTLAIKACVSLAAGLLVAAVVSSAIASRSPAPTPAPAGASVLPAGELDNALRLVDRALRLAAGQNVPCSGECIDDRDFVRNVRGVIDLCGKVGPAGYNPAATSPYRQLVTDLTAVCQQFTGPQAVPVPLSDGPQWRSTVQSAIARLDNSLWLNGGN